MDIHPSQYQTPLVNHSSTPVPVQVPVQTTYINDRTTGRKISQAFYLTGVFLLLSNSYKLLNNGYYIWSSQSYMFLNEAGCPTPKAYLVMAFIFFIIAYWIIKK